jgi:hypothetical protein
LLGWERWWEVLQPRWAGRRPVDAADNDVVHVRDELTGATGPLKSLAESLPGDQRAALRSAYVEDYEAFRSEEGIKAPLEYVLILGRTR